MASRFILEKELLYLEEISVCIWLPSMFWLLFNKLLIVYCLVVPIVNDLSRLVRWSCWYNEILDRSLCKAENFRNHGKHFVGWKFAMHRKLQEFFLIGLRTILTSIIYETCFVGSMIIYLGKWQENRTIVSETF